MANKSLMDQFNQPPEWSVFDRLRDEFDDIKATRLIERLTSVLEAYRDVTQPYHFQENTGGKNTPRIHDTYVFSTGLRARGSMGHRVVRVKPGQQVEIIDLDRVMDDSEIFKPRALHTHSSRLLKLTRNYRGRLEMTVKRRIPALKDSIGNAARWVEDLNFLYMRDATSFCDLTGARLAMTDAMMQAIDDLLPDHNTKIRGYVRNIVTQCLEKFDRDREGDTIAMLARAANALNPSALEALSRNPSSLSVRHYRWLTKDGNADVLAFRMALARACPIALLIDKFEDKFADTERGGDVDNALQRVFHATPERLYFYKTLSEDRVGITMARRLDTAAFFIETGKAAELPLRTPKDWEDLSVLLAASQRLARILDRPHPAIFQSCTDDILAGTLRLEEMTSPDFFTNVEMLRNRITTHALAPKIIGQGERMGIRIPVTHALYIASFQDCVRDAFTVVPAKIRAEVEKQTERVRLVNMVLRGKSVKEILESARFYSTYHDSEDAHWRNMTITNRMDEHAADYPWETVPGLHMEDDSCVIVPLASQADLLKNSRETYDDLWRRGAEAITRGAHFVALRRNFATQATAVLLEPDHVSPHWVVDEVVTAVNGKNRNNYAEIFQAYVEMPEFLDQVDLPRIRAARRAVLQRLQAAAHDGERLGMRDPSDPVERAAKLRLLQSHWPGGEQFEIDAHGYMSHPVVNARVQAMLTRLAPQYRTRTDRRAQPL